MKKIAILLVFTLGTFIVNAQSVVEGTKFMDNWSVGVNAGAVTPLTHASFFKGMRPGSYHNSGGTSSLSEGISRKILSKHSNLKRQRGNIRSGRKGQNGMNRPNA